MAEGKVAVERSIEIAASPDAVWEKIGRFGDMSWHPAIFATENPGGNAVGAVRVLTLGDKGGPTVTEELAAHSDSDRGYAYRILEVDPAVLPVTNYLSEIRVEAAGDGSRLTWGSRFDPPPGVTAEAASETMAGVYTGGFEAVRKALEG
jgi:hypothetical protein